MSPKPLVCGVDNVGATYGDAPTADPLCSALSVFMVVYWFMALPMDPVMPPISPMAMLA